MAVGRPNHRKHKKPKFKGSRRPPHLKTEYLGIRIRTKGNTTVWETTEEFDGNRFAVQLMARGHVAAEGAEQIVRELLDIIQSVNPLHLVGQVAAWSTVGNPNIDDAVGRFGMEARAEFLGGLALSFNQPTSELAGPLEVQRSILLLEKLFEFERTRILSEEIKNGPDSRSHLDLVRFVSRLENLFDRTQGFTSHLEAIVAEVFEPLRDMCIGELGFSPADIPKIVRAHIARRQEIYQSRLELSRGIPKAQLKDLRISRKFALMSWVIFGYVDPKGDTTAEELATAAGLPAVEVESALKALVSPWGSQLGLRRPGEPNRFRRYPVLEGRDSRYSIPLTWSVLHEVFGWFRDMLRSQGKLTLLKAFYDARSRATETLVVHTLEAIFGTDHVLANIEYPIPGTNWAEVDSLVWLGDHALVVECKGHGLSDAYRAGDVNYARAHFGDVVDHAFSQSERAANYLTSGGTKLRQKQGKVAINWLPVSGATRIVVSFERIDPFVLVAARLAEELRSSSPTWVVCLADLLLVADILSEPHEFFAYAFLRAELAKNSSVAFLSEADVLGAFLYDRLDSYRKLVASGDNQSVMLNHHSGPLNVYFGARALGFPAEKPTLKIPVATVRKLRKMYENSASDWTSRVRELVISLSDVE